MDATTKPTLLGLPPSIRLHILRLLLVRQQSPLTVSYDFTENIPIDARILRNNNLNNAASILRTCTQLHSEGALILYGANVFQTTVRDIYRFAYIFLATIGFQNISFVRNIAIHVDERGDGRMVTIELFRALEQFPELQNLETFSLTADLTKPNPRYVDVVGFCKYWTMRVMDQIPRLTKLVINDEVEERFVVRGTADGVASKEERGDTLLDRKEELEKSLAQEEELARRSRETIMNDRALANHLAEMEMSSWS